MENLLHMFLSCICITIPEYIFMIIVTLRLMGRKDVLDFYDFKNNAKIILKIVIPPAIIINILNYIIKTPSSINSSIALLILYLLLIYILIKHSIINYPKLYIKSFSFFIVSILISMAIETITLPIIFKLTNRTFEEIKVNFYLVLLCSISSRIIDIVILTWIFINKNRKFQVNMLEYIFKNKFFMESSIYLGFGLIIFEAYVLKLILINNFLNIVNTIYEQLFIVIGTTFLIPSLLILMVYTYINYCVIINHSEKQSNLDD